MKKTLCTTAIALMLLAGFAVSGSASEKCTELLTTTCTGCHSTSNFCNKLGESAETWNALLKRMEANGATLSADDMKELAECLSTSSPEAQAVCTK